jgi:hypothetical protein
MQSYLGSVVIDDVLRWLSGGVFEPDDVPEHEPGTCGWIYKTAAWKDWEVSAFKKALLVTGKAGKQRVPLELASLSAIRLRKRKISPC